MYFVFYINKESKNKNLLLLTNALNVVLVPLKV